MRSQMRLAAALWSLNFLTGCTPGRLLQIATSRFAGQDLASSANSGWLLKLSNGVVVAAAASSGVACAVMLLWVSIVKVVIVICPLFSALVRGLDHWKISGGNAVDRETSNCCGGHAEDRFGWSSLGAAIRKDGPDLRRQRICPGIHAGGTSLP